VLDGLNEERLVIAAECLGLGETALESGIAYANEREVFGGPIGANQAINTRSRRRTPTCSPRRR